MPPPTEPQPRESFVPFSINFDTEVTSRLASSGLSAWKQFILDCGIDQVWS